MLNRRNITYNFKNLQEVWLERKRTIFMVIKLPMHPNYRHFCQKKLIKETQYIFLQAK